MGAHVVSTGASLPAAANHHVPALGDEVMQGHTQAITSLSCSTQGTLLVSASEDRTVRAWDIQSRQCIQVSNLKGRVSNMLTLGQVPSRLLVSKPVEKLVPLAALRRYNNKAKAAADLLPIRRSLCHVPENPLVYAAPFQGSSQKRRPEVTSVDVNTSEVKRLRSENERWQALN